MVGEQVPDDEGVFEPDVELLASDETRALIERVREAGALDLCPLRAIGYDAERPAAERCLALAVLGDVLGEADALVHFDDVAATLPDDETGPLLAALSTYAPGLAVEATGEAVVA